MQRIYFKKSSEKLFQSNENAILKDLIINLKQQGVFGEELKNHLNKIFNEHPEYTYDLGIDLQFGSFQQVIINKSNKKESVTTDFDIALEYTLHTSSYDLIAALPKGEFVIADKNGLIKSYVLERKTQAILLKE